ncbi:hypothetical protein ES703_45592 [subsurface metagenome]
MNDLMKIEPLNNPEVGSSNLPSATSCYECARNSHPGFEGFDE